MKSRIKGGIAGEMEGKMVAGGGLKQFGVNSRGESGSLPLVAAHSVLGQNTTWAKTNMKCLLPHRK